VTITSIIPLVARPATDDDAAALAELRAGQHVRVPSGAPGTVIGFYHRDASTVVVALDDGGSCEVDPAALNQAA
jgi:hypothetical protein